MSQSSSHSSYQASDFGHSPLMFYYEVTMACDLVCKHCRASAQEQAHPDELRTAQAKALLDQVSTFPRRPTVVFTGGDPLKCADIYELIAHGAGIGLQIARNALGHAAGHAGRLPTSQGCGRYPSGNQPRWPRCRDA